MGVGGVNEVMINIESIQCLPEIESALKNLLTACKETLQLHTW